MNSYVALQKNVKNRNKSLSIASLAKIILQYQFIYAKNKEGVNFGKWLIFRSCISKNEAPINF